MSIKLLQWNIGGCRIRKEDADPTKESSYVIDGIDYICKIIKAHNPDILTFQETHENESLSQAKEIANALGYPHVINDQYDQSHIDPNYRLGQAIISKYTLAEHSFVLYKNPNLEIVRENGDYWKTHDKGISSCRVEISGQFDVCVRTTHLVPYTKFDRSFEDADLQPIFADMDKKAATNEKHVLFPGDFNYDNPSCRALFPTFFSGGGSEILQHDSTTPKGRKYDHILYKGMNCKESEVLRGLLTDHFPIISSFEI